MRWLLLTDGLSPFEMGGMQKHSSNLLRYLLKEGHFVSVAHCISQYRKIVSEEVRDQLSLTNFENCDIRQFVFPKMNALPGHYIKESYAYSVKLFQYYQGQHTQWDIVFAQGFTGWKFIEERKKGNWKIPVVTHFHGLEMFQSAIGWRDRLKQYLFRSPVRWNLLHSDATVSLGGRITEIIRHVGIPDSRIIHLPVAIDDKWFSAVSRPVSSEIRALFVGRFESRKGLDTLLKSFDEITRSTHHITLSIVGNIPFSKRLSIKNVSYLGAISQEDEMMSIMDEHDVLIVPSRAEGMPTVILEAMARGMAIWCTPVGANEVMVNDDNGYVFLSFQLKDMLHGLEILAQSPVQELREMGRKGREKCAQNWNWIVVIKQLMGDIKRVTHQGHVG